METTFWEKYVDRKSGSKQKFYKKLNIGIFFHIIFVHSIKPSRRWFVCLYLSHPLETQDRQELLFVQGFNVIKYVI